MRAATSSQRALRPPGSLDVATDTIPLLSMIKGRLSYLSARQKLLAENVANADTPGYKPKDLKPFDKLLAAQGGGSAAAGGLTRTNPMHLSAPGHNATTGQPVGAPDSETRMDGNSVVLEEEMLKMSESRSDYDTAVSLYQQSMSMLQTAVRKPGG